MVPVTEMENTGGDIVNFPRLEGYEEDIPNMEYVQFEATLAFI